MFVSHWFSFDLHVLVSKTVLAVNLATIADAPGPLRGIAAFALVAAVGGLLLFRYRAFVDRSIEASMATPVRSVGYGVAAHAVIGFAGVYLASQLGSAGGSVAFVAGVLVLLVVGSLGFVVVGSIIGSLMGTPDRRVGLAAGAGIAAIAGVLAPATGALVWFVVVSMGIGGPARRWLHADALDDV